MERADHELTTIFTREEEIQEEIQGAGLEYTDAENKITISQYKKKSLIKASNKQKGIGLVKAHRTIFPDIVIVGAHARKVVKERLGNVKLREIKVSKNAFSSGKNASSSGKNASSSGEWKITIQKI